MCNPYSGLNGTPVVLCCFGKSTDKKLIVKVKPQSRNDPEIRKKIESALPPNSSFQSDFDELGLAVINLPESTDLFEVARKLEEEDVVQFAEPTLMDSGS